MSATSVKSPGGISAIIDALIWIEFTRGSQSVLENLYATCDAMFGHPPSTVSSPTREIVHDIVWGMADEKRLRRVTGAVRLSRADTGRFRESAPELQNMPIRMSPEARKMANSFRAKLFGGVK